MDLRGGAPFARFGQAPDVAQLRAGTGSSRAPPTMFLRDPRLCVVADDASSTKRRSLLAIAGTLLSEISIPKLVTSWLLLIVVPAILLGLFPLVSSGWLAVLSRKI